MLIGAYLTFVNWRENQFGCKEAGRGSVRPLAVIFWDAAQSDTKNCSLMAKGFEKSHLINLLKFRHLILLLLVSQSEDFGRKEKFQMSYQH